MVVVSSLRYRYALEKELIFPDFSVEKGKACVLLGNSGSGKTTLLHLMGGLLEVAEGEVLIDGQDLSALSEGQLDRFRGKHMGFIFQQNHLISALSVRKNLLLASFLAGLPGDDQRVEDVLGQLGLLAKKDARVRHLSQGQAQRVAIARAVLNKPAVILADEPTSALDDYHCERVIRMLLEVSDINQSTLVVATHDQRVKAVIPHQIIIENP